jgi:hypothetical protein
MADLHVTAAPELVGTNAVVTVWHGRPSAAGAAGRSDKYLIDFARGTFLTLTPVMWEALVQLIGAAYDFTNDKGA